MGKPVMRRIFAKVTTVFEDLHCYPDAPDVVGYLKHPHRHLFHVTVWLQQLHEDREVEFVQLKHRIDDIVETEVKSMDSRKSCEMMADALFQSLVSVYPGRECRIEILEDGECGAVVEYS